MLIVYDKKCNIHNEKNFSCKFSYESFVAKDKNSFSIYMYLNCYDIPNSILSTEDGAVVGRGLT